MAATLLLKERHVLADNAFVELVVWRLPEIPKGSTHFFKYRLALIVDRECVLRYDNEIGKGDHKHIGNEEHEYRFVSAEKLIDDFWQDVDDWREQNG